MSQRSYSGPPLEGERETVYATAPEQPGTVRAENVPLSRDQQPGRLEPPDVDVAGDEQTTLADWRRSA